VGGTIGGLIGGGGGTLIEPGGGTIIGGVGGAEEGCDIGSGVETALQLMQMASTFTKAGPADCSREPKQCEVQYQQDSEICRNLSSPGARGRCWESAAERRAYCIRTRGEVGWPPLLKK
jgi:hypothetical protein